MEQSDRKNLETHAKGVQKLMPKVTVIICTHNRSKKLLDTLIALENQTISKDEFELIVVDDGSTDDTPEILNKFKQNSSINVRIYNQKDSGLAVSRNNALQYAKGTIIAMTDDDCVPDKNWLKAVLPYFNDKEVVGVNGYVYSANQKTTYFDGAPVTKYSKNMVGGRTANMFYRKNIILEIDGFDERFIMPFGPKKGFREDTDLLWRIQKKGKVIFASNVRVYHPPRPLTIKDTVNNQKTGFLDALLFLKYPSLLTLKMVFGPKSLFIFKIILRLPFFLSGMIYFSIK
jgi:glycosyltransferase involved in cell wall biosynthesis